RERVPLVSELIRNRAVERETWVEARVNASGCVSRRGFLRAAGVGAAGIAGLGWTGFLAARAEELREKHKACILPWMAGGPTQFETFDPKPGAETQGPTNAIPTAAAGVSIAEHWTKTAGVMGDVAVIRSMTTKEGNHGRATYLLHTGYAPSGGI